LPFAFVLGYYFCFARYHRAGWSPEIDPRYILAQNNQPWDSQIAGKRPQPRRSSPNEFGLLSTYKQHKRHVTSLKDNSHCKPKPTPPPASHLLVIPDCRYCQLSDPLPPSPGLGLPAFSRRPSRVQHKRWG
jgi:hypothetical protein